MIEVAIAAVLLIAVTVFVFRRGLVAALSKEITRALNSASDHQ